MHAKAVPAPPARHTGGASAYVVIAVIALVAGSMAFVPQPKPAAQPRQTMNLGVLRSQPQPADHSASPTHRSQRAVIRDGSVIVTDATGHKERAIPIKGKLAMLRWSLDGNQIAVATSEPLYVSFINVASGRAIETVYVGSIPVDLAWNREGRLAVADNQKCSVTVFNADRSRTSVKLDSTPLALAWSPDDRQLAIANVDLPYEGYVTFYDGSAMMKKGLGAWMPSGMTWAADSRTLAIKDAAHGTTVTLPSLRS